MSIRRTIKRNETGRIPNSFPKSSLIISVQDNGYRLYESFYLSECILQFIIDANFYNLDNMISGCRTTQPVNST